MPYAYDASYYTYEYYYLLPYVGPDGLTTTMSTYGYTTGFRFIYAEDDYSVGDEATVVSWSSVASGSNEVQTVNLYGTDKYNDDGALQTAVSAAALIAGVAAFF